MGTLMARDYKGIGHLNETLRKTVVETSLDSIRKYLVRRLTPLECCRLQGFDDEWADIPKITDMSDNDIEFWRKVYLTHMQINDKKPNKVISEQRDNMKIQLVKWYNSLHTDSNEYKMWGNGMAAPNAKFVISRACEHLRTLPSYNGTITLGSMFDGSGTMPMCIEQENDGKAVWASEIEPYPIAVTRHNIPNMVHLGSVTDFQGGNITPVDIITFGSPCQDVSIAGKRKGILNKNNGDTQTTRSGLFFTAIERIKEMLIATNGAYPKIVIWENVPGAFSSNKGADFNIVLNELLHLGCPNEFIRQPILRGKAKWNKYADYGTVAYRTVNAQFWGVPQRRRRIYAIADITGECAGQILFEQKGLPWHFTPGESKGNTTAAAATNGTGVSNCVGRKSLANEKDNIGPILASCGKKYFLGNQEAFSGDYFIVEEPIFCLQGNCIDRADTAGCNGAGFKEDISYTLNTVDKHSVAFHLTQDPICKKNLQCLKTGVADAIVYDNHAQDSRITQCNDIACTVSAAYGMGGGNTPLVLHSFAQDNYTDYSEGFATLKACGGSETLIAQSQTN